MTSVFDLKNYFFLLKEVVRAYPKMNTPLQQLLAHEFLLNLTEELKNKESNRFEEVNKEYQLLNKVFSKSEQYKRFL